MTINYAQQIANYEDLVRQDYCKLLEIKEAKANEKIFWSAIQERKLRDASRAYERTKKKLAQLKLKLEELENAGENEG